MKLHHLLLIALAFMGLTACEKKSEKIKIAMERMAEFVAENRKA
mgnify:CR=1 FL=1